jgi:type I restriction-modification system DNA methylase subunit
VTGILRASCSTKALAACSSSGVSPPTLFRAFLWRIIVVQAVTKSGQIKSLSFTAQQFKSVVSGDEKSRILALKELLDYPIARKDPQGSRFWFLRPGESHSAAEETQPIAVGFYDELNSYSDREIKAFLTSPEQQQEIYGHYVDRVNEQKPVMYLLLPSGETGQAALVLPTEGGLKQRNIQNFEIGSPELRSRLERLKQGTLPVAHKYLSIPLAEFAFYKPIETAKELAQQLAKVAKKIEEIIPQVYEQEEEDGYLHKLLKNFKKDLLPFLNVKAKTDKEYGFADIYAQTVAYALFTARVFSHISWQKELQLDPAVKQPLFDRESAWQQLPETNPFLRQLFKDVSKQKAEDLGDELITEIANIFGILRAAKMEAILSDFSQTGNRDDIIIHFYEPFLAAYNPKLKKNRGVYYTPESVVSYMVRSVDILLKDKFHKPLGLADPDVMILDPATGTGTFLLWIFQLVEKRFKGTDGDVESQRLIKERFGDMSWTQYVRDHLLPRVAGFELLMAPYAIAHLKLSLFLQESGYEFDANQRLKVYLTNTLDNAPRKSETLFDEFIANEANEATSIKQDEPVMVVVGNPPYSGHSENKGEWISNLLKDYYQVDGKPLGEKNSKWLQDDYVKFIRFSQWRIQQTGMGILAFITNHGYLDNPTFKGMRRSLDKTFDEMYVFDLHGNSNKEKVSPDGSEDQSVFDIKAVGVAIGLMVKLPVQE